MVPAWVESATPKLAVKRAVSPGCAAARRARSRSSSESAPKRSRSGSTSTNSSPPQRPSRSSSRIACSVTWANSLSARSPASWPCASLSVLKRSRSAITNANERPSRRTSRACDSIVRRLLSPVSPSVEACSWVFSNARTVPMRAPACDARVLRRATASLPSGLASGPVVCRTPSERPMKLMGTHTAEHAPTGRSRSCGHEFKALLVSNTTAEPRRTATHEKGDFTGQLGAPAEGCVAARRRLARLESDSNSSIGVASEMSSIARSTTSKTSCSSSAISSASLSWLANPSRCAWVESARSSCRRSVASRALMTTPRRLRSERRSVARASRWRQVPAASRRRKVNDEGSPVRAAWARTAPSSSCTKRSSPSPSSSASGRPILAASERLA